ncbi:hypothetical protein ES703_109823 [subsurface metagenome]
MVKEKGHQTLKIAREVKQLDSVLDAIGAHNPSVWLPIIKTVAPFLVRIGIRHVLRKMSKTTSEGNIEGAVDFVRAILTRIGAKGEQSSNSKKPKKKD